MSFDQEPDADPHGECAAEIHRLQEELQAAIAGAEAIREACVSECQEHASAIGYMASVGRLTNQEHAKLDAIHQCIEAIRSLDLDPIRAGRELLEPLRKDALRYRWLRAKESATAGVVQRRIDEYGFEMLCEDELDAAIDVAVAIGDKT